MTKDKESPGITEVSIVGIDMPFLQMTRVMIKLSFAAALATLVTSLLWIVVGAVFMIVGGVVGTVAMTVLGVLLTALAQG